MFTNFQVGIHVSSFISTCESCSVNPFVITRAAPKVMPPILLCWPTTSEADVGGMAVEVEPSHQYSVNFFRRATDDSRGAV